MSDAPPSFAAPFSDMAARIDHNSRADFAGAFVIVPPNGEAVTVLSLDAQQDASAFWAMVKTRIDIMWKTLQQQEQQRQTGWNSR